MKRLQRIAAIGLSVIMLALCLCACDNGQSAGNEETTTTAAVTTDSADFSTESNQESLTSKIELKVGESKQLADMDDASYEIDDADVVEVSDDGTLTAKAAGSATVVQSDPEGDKIYTYIVTVTE